MNYQNSIAKQKKNKSVTTIKTLELENIGLFEQLKLDFDQKCAVLIGLNGTGKTTILRSLALSLIGVQEGVHENNIAESLLRIMGRKENQGNWAQSGKIRTILEIDGEEYTNEVILTPNWQTGDIQIQKADTALFDDKGYLKSLIIGFSQQRGIFTKLRRKTPTIKIMPPKVGDLLALINNDEGGTLHSFVSWIANLDIDIKNGAVKKRRLLEKAFDIFSEIAEEKVRFDAVTSVDPLELWIKTKDSPHGIPIRLTSLGYQSIMAWIGYFLKRIYEANGGVDNFYEAPAIVIVDEIDLFLHPLWQSRILKVLIKNFPNTQFIVTTHSPLVVAGLAFKQVTQLYYEENKLVAKQNEVDIWVWQYQDILSRLFQTQQHFTEYEEKVLPEIKKLRAIEQRTQEQEQKLKKLIETYHRIEESRAAVDEIAAIRQRLESKENELTALIQNLSKHNALY